MDTLVVLKKDLNHECIFLNINTIASKLTQENWFQFELNDNKPSMVSSLKSEKSQNQNKMFIFLLHITGKEI